MNSENYTHDYYPNYTHGGNILSMLEWHFFYLFHCLTRIDSKWISPFSVDFSYYQSHHLMTYIFSQMKCLAFLFTRNVPLILLSSTVYLVFDVVSSKQQSNHKISERIENRTSSVNFNRERLFVQSRESTHTRCTKEDNMRINK